MLSKITVFNANSVDPDQTRRSAASDLGLHFCQCPFYGTPGINGLRHPQVGGTFVV